MNERNDYTPEPENEPLPLDEELMEIAVDLGFQESSTAKRLREQLTLGMPEQESFRILGLYNSQLREDTPADQDLPIGNIVLAVNVMSVVAMLRCGRYEDARNDLHDTIMAAEQSGELDLADYLAELLSEIPE